MYYNNEKIEFIIYIKQWYKFKDKMQFKTDYNLNNK